MARELQVIADTYELAKYLSERVAKFPRHQRYTLGAEVERGVRHVLGQLIRAKYASGADAKGAYLSAVNVELEVLRFQVRLAVDLKALPVKSHGHAADLMHRVGGQVGGWFKSLPRP